MLSLVTSSMAHATPSATPHKGAQTSHRSLKLSQYRLAKELGVPAMRISHVVHGRRPVTAELALRLGRYFGQNPRYWINLQSRYDMDMAEDALYEQVARQVRPMAASA